jgi:hypothetical protein
LTSFVNKLVVFLADVARFLADLKNGGLARLSRNLRWNLFEEIDVRALEVLERDPARLNSGIHPNDVSDFRCKFGEHGECGELSASPSGDVERWESLEETLDTAHVGDGE